MFTARNSAAYVRLPTAYLFVLMNAFYWPIARSFCLAQVTTALRALPTSEQSVEASGHETTALADVATARHAGEPRALIPANRLALC